MCIKPPRIHAKKRRHHYEIAVRSELTDEVKTHNFKTPDDKTVNIKNPNLKTPKVNHTSDYFSQL